MATEDLKYEILAEDFSEYDLSFKMIVVGDSGIGKSCLTLKGTKNHFEECYSPTVGFEFFIFNIKIDYKNIKLQIWDTCGQETYRSLITSFYRNSSLAIIAYAINDKNSFGNIEVWLNEIKSQATPEIKIFLVGTKADLENERQIQKEEAEKFKEDHAINYFIETSAKTGFNAQNVFIEAAKELYKEHLEYKDRASRPGSIKQISYQEEINNKVLLDEGEDEENTSKKKKICCK